MDEQKRTEHALDVLGVDLPRTVDPQAETVARAFHDAYEDLAPLFGYRTRTETAVPWDEVPPANKALMIATVRVLLNAGTIRARELRRGGW